MAGSVADRLQRERRRRFVGREHELRTFGRVLERGDDPPGVVFVHGPGGVGKTTLLAELAEAASAAGRRPVQVDGQEAEPSPSGFTAGLAAALAQPPTDDLAGTVDDDVVILVDTFEWLSPIEGWLRERFLPRLPAGCLVVLAGRRPPSPAWLGDPGWRDLLHVVALRNLAPGDVRTYLGIEGLPDGLTDQVVELTHGHPLAMSLLVDALHRSGPGATAPPSWADAPDLVAALLGRIVDEVPSDRELAALHVCARARATTEAMLRAVLPGDDAPRLFEWLRAQTFVTASGDGLRPHDIARAVIDADLRWRDPERYASTYRRVRQHQVERIRRGARAPADRQRAVADTVFLVRHHPVAGGVYWDLGTLADSFAEPVTADDAPELVELTRRRQGDEQAALAAHWYDRQPGSFRAFRSSRGALVGYAAYLDLEAASPQDIDADPGAAAMWRHAQRHGPSRAGEAVKAWRFLVDAADGAERDSHAAGTMLGAWHVNEVLLRGPTAWDFIGVYTDEEHWEEFLAHYDFRRTPEADYRIGDRTYVVFGHDWRRVGVDEWLELTAAHDLGAPIDPALATGGDLVVLSADEFADAVKDALRHLHDTRALARNPLLRCAVVQAARPDEAERPEAVLRRLVETATAELGRSEATAPLERVLDRTFLRPAPSQEKAAEVLDLSFSTFRRRRDRAVALVTDWLWDRELHGPPDADEAPGG